MRCVFRLLLYATDGGHIPAADMGHLTAYSINGVARGRPQKQSSLNRWNLRTFQAAAQQWLPAAAQKTLESIAESPRVQDVQDFCTDVWEHLSASRRQTSPV